MLTATGGPAARVRTVAGLEDRVGAAPSVIKLKELGFLDEGCRSVLAASPIAAFGYRSEDGSSTTTFVGGAPGFTRVHSSQRISFSLANGSRPTGAVSLFFLLPGVGEVLRVNGTVAAVKGERVSIEVAQAYVHCAQAVLRARLWQPPAPASKAGPVSGSGPLTSPDVAEFLAAAPFLALSSWDQDGGSDTSPRGDQPLVARILDGRTLIIPDRKGNKRADTLHNLLQDEQLSLAALVPGRTGVLQVRGRGIITTDAELLKPHALRGVSPHAALLIEVEHAEVSSNDAVRAARLWDPQRQVQPGAVPDLMALASRHLATNLATAGGGGLPALLLRLLGSIPGFERLIRRIMNQAYRSGLVKEGYEQITTGPSPQDAVSPLRPVRIVQVHRETPSTARITLQDTGENPAPFDFRPGQYFTLVADVAGQSVRRAYSACSVPGTDQLEIAVKQVPGGLLSTHLHALAAGASLGLIGPSGSFHSGAQPDGEMLLIAAGSGITPMISLIRTHLPKRPIALLYCSRSEAEIIFADELARLEREFPGQFSVTHVLSSRDGRLDAAGLQAWITQQAPGPQAHYYVCGPQPLTDLVQDAVKDRPERVHHEQYTRGALGEIPREPQPLLVRSGEKTLGDKTVEPGQTLLDAGLAAGLPMPYSCTIGNCGDCRVRLISGQVALAEPNCLTEAEKADGYVLTCVGRPLSEVVLDIAES
ncbi:2Fe-2S iron-sulfur cluster-binding protein [Kineosporia babensis]|uniref:FAD-binding oxidoreductase n=1 Tax=Kineosporia babensis TaxID=499548 RepID=A0A9X1NDA8_9ACTN|nr:2Fe-2S iron-sulfur cluster-binding protein [Kineosporia babensis]MCD5312008.1 FAD-binding oxidoreductase [Kineosporia babensis]